MFSYNHSAAVFFLSVHQEWDIILWCVFFLGQCTYVLKRAAMAIRSKTNPVKNRRQFLYANWDILAFRSLIELVLIYYPFRHLNLGSIADLFHVGLPSWLPADGHMGTMGFFACGIASDVLLDWIAVNERVPAFIRKFIQEQVPPVPSVLGGPQ